MIQNLNNDLIYLITTYLCSIDSRKIKKILKLKVYLNPRCNIYSFMDHTGIDCACNNPNGHTGLVPWMQFG